MPAFIEIAEWQETRGGNHSPVNGGGDVKSYRLTLVDNKYVLEGSQFDARGGLRWTPLKEWRRDGQGGDGVLAILAMGLHQVGARAPEPFTDMDLPQCIVPRRL